MEILEREGHSGPPLVDHLPIPETEELLLHPPPDFHASHDGAFSPHSVRSPRSPPLQQYPSPPARRARGSRGHYSEISEEDYSEDEDNDGDSLLDPSGKRGKQRRPFDLDLDRPLGSISLPYPFSLLSSYSPSSLSSLCSDAIWLRWPVIAAVAVIILVIIFLTSPAAVSPTTTTPPSDGSDSLYPSDLDGTGTGSSREPRGYHPLPVDSFKGVDASTLDPSTFPSGGRGAGGGDWGTGAGGNWGGGKPGEDPQEGLYPDTKPGRGGGRWGKAGGAAGAGGGGHFGEEAAEVEDYRDSAGVGREGEVVGEDLKRKRSRLDDEVVTWRGAPWRFDVGDWLSSCNGESGVIKTVEEVYGNKCMQDCNGVGTCHYDTGRCRCRIGYTGADCSHMDAHPCSSPPTSSPGVVAGSAWACAGECDLHSGLCFCGAASLFPLRPVPDPCGFAHDFVTFTRASASAVLPRSSPSAPSPTRAALHMTCECITCPASACHVRGRRGWWLRARGRVRGSATFTQASASVAPAHSSFSDPSPTPVASRMTSVIARAGVSGAVIARAGVSGAVIARAGVSGAVIARAVVSGAVIARAVVSGAVIARAVSRSLASAPHVPSSPSMYAPPPTLRAAAVDRTRKDTEALYANTTHYPGWCNTRPEAVGVGMGGSMAMGGAEPRARCTCDYDGAVGAFCHVPVAAFCVNQCSGHGTCIRGHCQCNEGWFSVDCSVPSQATFADPQLPAWLQPFDQAKRFGSGSGSRTSTEPGIAAQPQARKVGGGLGGGGKNHGPTEEEEEAALEAEMGGEEGEGEAGEEDGGGGRAYGGKGARGGERGGGEDEELGWRRRRRRRRLLGLDERGDSLGRQTDRRGALGDDLMGSSGDKGDYEEREAPAVDRSRGGFNERRWLRGRQDEEDGDGEADEETEGGEYGGEGAAGTAAGRGGGGGGAAGGGQAGAAAVGGRNEVVKRRPLVYMYDLPPQFNSDLLQGRRGKKECVPRLYDRLNRTAFLPDHIHGMEIALHEALLASKHRTTNAEEADFFFVPVYASCLWLRLTNGGDASGIQLLPHVQGNWAWHVAEMYSAVHRHIVHAYPHWNRSRGRDHLWPMGTDEGACLAPQAIWHGSMLTSWGNSMAAHSHSVKAAPQQRWDDIPLTLRGGHLCYSAAKDIVLPAWLPPNVKHLHEQYWLRSFEEREHLFYFAGDLGSEYKGGSPDSRFSFGIRQAVAREFASVPNNKGQLGSQQEEGVIVTYERGKGHSAQLGNARFCGVFPSNGFNADMEEAMKHGCIPVIIQDGIHLPFENALDYASFSVRIEERDIPNMLTKLKAITAEHGSALQGTVQKVWQRLSYHSVIAQEAKRQQDEYGHNEAWAFGISLLKDDDAIDTLIEVLHYKLHNDRWRRVFNYKQSRDELEKYFGVPKSCLVV
ncbi:unnamed protein product [Closterium sp. NIES-53]